MANNVFISFRYSDGIKYKEKMVELFDKSEDTVDFSEDIDRSNLSDNMIQKCLYGKLKKSSVTILILTPGSINHNKIQYTGTYNDWIYDELRYSLEDRENNRTNGMIAVYTPEAKNIICSCVSPNILQIKNFDNLARANMMNVKPEYKMEKKYGQYNKKYDSYCSLFSFEEFYHNYSSLIEDAVWKRNNKNKYNIVKRL